MDLDPDPDGSGFFCRSGSDIKNPDLSFFALTYSGTNKN